MFAAYGQQMPAKPTQSEPAKPEAGPGQEKQPKTELEAGYDFDRVVWCVYLTPPLRSGL